VLAGEFEGEDLPLYDFEIRYRGGLKNALLHPNRPGAEHKLAEGQVSVAGVSNRLSEFGVAGRTEHWTTGV
jgi:hypothetical protein